MGFQATKIETFSWRRSPRPPVSLWTLVTTPLGKSLVTGRRFSEAAFAFCGKRTSLVLSQDPPIWNKTLQALSSSDSSNAANVLLKRRWNTFRLISSSGHYSDSRFFFIFVIYSDPCLLWSTGWAVVWRIWRQNHWHAEWAAHLCQPSWKPSRSVLDQLSQTPS